MWTRARVFPDYFTMVMATGIVSVDAATLGWPGLGRALLAVNILSWCLLWAAGAVRLAIEPRALARALVRHQTGPGFLSVVAGTAVLGTQFHALHLATWVMRPLLWLSAILWAIVTYGFLFGVTTVSDKPGLEAGFSGQWLLLVVATESLASLAASVIGASAFPPQGLLFACTALILAGGVFYLFIGSITLYRLTFIPMPPQDVTGPWWISESAAALVALAGAKLIAQPNLHLGHVDLHLVLVPFVLFFWADASFWVPLLALLFAWKYAIRRRRMSYSVAFWSVVFPLGMYAAATLNLGSTFGLPFLHPLGRAFFWIALLAWAVSLLGALGRFA